MHIPLPGLLALRYPASTASFPDSTVLLRSPRLQRASIFALVMTSSSLPTPEL
ncbi:hypothetical protein B0H13DRAFT_2324383 [Mycena leptocephala]|nr:hypothetical protein B0H13DRAFT_2324383 [Mycena leptocephala]